MKKRILALALAGTTAFSVFGAAMSANAANSNWWNSQYDSTHDQWNIDRYKSYAPAGDLEWTTNATQVGVTEVANVYSTNASLSGNLDLSKVTGKLYVLPNGDNKNISAISKMGEDVYFDNTDDFMKTVHPEYQAVTVTEGKFSVNGTPYVVVQTSGSNENAKYTAYTEKYYNDNKTTLNLGAIATDLTTNDGAGHMDYGYISASIDGVNNQGANGITYISSDPVLNGGWKYNNEIQNLLNQYVATNGAYYIAEMMNRTQDNNGPLGTNLTYYSAVTVITSPAGTAGNMYSPMGYTALDSTDPTDYDAVMANPVQATGEVYLYDYYGNLPNGISADMFTSAWGNGTAAQLMSKYNNNAVSGTLTHDIGRYGAKGVREQVVDAWENFIDELGIADASATRKTAWAKDTLENYLYQYYDANYVTSWYEDGNGNWTVTITNGKNVDLYNFGGLIADILELSPANKVVDAQTSEMVYLMQQYDKYMDGYVDQKPVETDDWGDLLVSLAQAPTEDEFATSTAYKRYTNKAEDLVEAYEEADTSVAVNMAEADLYDFVTTYNSAYKYKTKVDTTALGNSIDSTYYNYNWKAAYNVDVAGTADDIHVPAGIYVGAFDANGKLDTNPVDKQLSVYALYPVADYAGSVTTGSYPGVDTKVYGVTQEYFWFYNVYALAYDVLSNNKYQSTVDLMASSLDEAVAALTPDSKSTASASDILGAEEQNDKLTSTVETDYTAAMWANKTKISDYITNRVSNDEIGDVGSNNAEAIAKEVAYYMGWQKYQTTVTRSDINSVSAAKTQAQTALTNLRNDEENYNAAQANALQKAIDECDVIIDLYNGDYSKSAKSQSVNGALTLLVGDKDQILKSDCTNAVQAVEDAINFSNIIMGWSQDKDGNWMYGTEEGYLNDGWHQVDGGKTWFYFNEDGTAKQSEWWQDGSTWYWFNSNCGAAVGWAKIDGDWYYFKGNNAMKTGWEKVEGSWYYMNSSGKMVTGWCQINGTWYYFSKESNALGQMLANTTTPDGYKVDANGALVE